MPEIAELFGMSVQLAHVLAYRWPPRLTCADCTIPDNTKIQVLLKDGTSFNGIFRNSAGWPWVAVQNHEPFSLAQHSRDLLEVKAIVPLNDSYSDQNRKFGKIAYQQPRSSQQYQETLWGLAAELTNRETKIAQPDYSQKILRAMQLENQFHALADQIALAKTKRRYILFCALRKKRGEPLPNPLDLMGSPLDAQVLQVPKESDFDPDPKVRKRRSLGPSIAYPTEAEVRASLRDAQNKLAKPGISQKKRATLKRIVETRQKQLNRRLYREAIEQLERETKCIATRTRSAPSLVKQA